MFLWVRTYRVWPVPPTFPLLLDASRCCCKFGRMMSPLTNRSFVLVISPLMINESGKCSAYLYDSQLSQGSDTELGIWSPFHQRTSPMRNSPLGSCETLRRVVDDTSYYTPCPFPLQDMLFDLCETPSGL